MTEAQRRQSQYALALGWLGLCLLLPPEWIGGICIGWLVRTVYEEVFGR